MSHLYSRISCHDVFLIIQCGNLDSVIYAIDSDNSEIDSDKRYRHTININQLICQEEEDSEEEEEEGLQVYPPSIKGIIWKQCKKRISMVGCCTQ